MSKIFVAREQRLNVDEASNRGDLVVLSSHTGASKPQDNNYGLEPDRIVGQIGKKLITFNPEEDYLLLDGQLIYNCVACGILSLFYDKFNLLVWKKGYCKREMVIPTIERRRKEDMRQEVYWAVNEAHPIDLKPIFYFIDIKDNVDPYDPETVWPLIQKKARDFSNQDRLILCGSTVMNIVATIYLARRLGGPITIGLLHHKTHSYIWRTLTIDKDFLRRLCR